MYKPETEDMLPREAPKPIDAAAAFMEAKPTVPELSLVFGQGGNASANSKSSNSDSNKEQGQTQTYADWKRQVLPKVTFPPKVTFADNQPESKEYLAPTSNLYPLRSAAPSNNSYPQISVPYPNISEMNKQPIPCLSNDMQYKRFYGENNQMMPPPFTGATNQEFFYTHQQQIPIPQRRSLESLSSSRVGAVTYKKEEVLSICAGTQTDFSAPSQQNLNNYVTKEDFGKLMDIIENLRSDQRRMLQFCEAFLQKDFKRTNDNLSRDVAVQCELLVSNNSTNSLKRPINLQKECIIEESPQESPTSTEAIISSGLPLAPNNFFNRLADLPANNQSPRSSKPIAQSTAYRPNSPRLAKEKELNVLPALPKPTTEKSLVMNELALKYLPNEKLKDILKKLDINSPPAAQEQTNLPMMGRVGTPLKEVDNFTRSPNDMSNASYKYLKKYRLLPEEENNREKYDNSPTPYGVKNSPAGAYQPQNSPFMPRSQSPLVMMGRNNGSPKVPQGSEPNQENNIDLANIKMQPKLI